MMNLPLGIIVAALGGLAVGIERQWSGHASGPLARFGGVRTFSMLGGVAGIAGWLWASDRQALGAILLAAPASLIVAAYVAASRVDVEATTEVGGFIVLGAGVLAGLGHLALASGIIAITSVFLIEKSRLHSMVARIDDVSLRAAARFAVMAVVVLPLLPEGPFGPWDVVRPRELWLLVLFFSGLNFAGYIARRAVGEGHGYPLAGLLGGLISSTNVTLTFSQASRTSTPLCMPLAHGVVAACTVLFLRAFVATLVLNPALARALVPYLTAPFLVGLALLVTSLRDSPAQTEAVPLPRNPLRVPAALQMTAVFQAVMLAVAMVHHTWGNAGVVASGAVLGITDIDALTISMARGAGADLPVEIAAQAIAIGILTNTLLKLGIVLVVGVAQFRRFAAPTLAAMAAVISGTLVLWR